jgi:hypothetical protein
MRVAEIPCFPQYTVCSDGGIFSRRARRELKSRHAGRGYRKVSLWNLDGMKEFYVHDLVSAAFIGPRPAGRIEVNHKNGDKTDNQVDNLEYLTSAQNKEHARNVLRLYCGRRARCGRLSDAQVYRIRNLAKEGQKYELIALHFHVTKSTVSDIHCRRTWKHLPEKRAS